MHVIQLKHSDYFKFQGFLKLTENSLKSGNIPESKQRKIAFLQKYIIPNRNLFKAKGAQLCTTRIAADLGVKAQTVMNWIKSLIRSRCLSVANGYWAKGHVSKHYVVNEDNKAFQDVLNEYNGYGTTVERVSHNKQLKYEFREKAWKQFDFCTPTRKSITFLASTYLGCPTQFRDALIKNLPDSFLQSPSFSNAHRPMIYEFFRALKFVTDDRNKKLNTDRVPEPYYCPKKLDDFIGDDMFSRLDRDEKACHKEINKNVRGVLININEKLSKANGRKKKRLQEFRKAFYWLMDYRTDEDYEMYEGFAPYHSLEMLR